MLDTPKPDANDNRGEAWELIPWFVNGTLSEAENDQVSLHIRSNPEFAAEVARQYALAKRVATEDPFEVPLAQSWKRLQAQVRAEERTNASRATSRAARGTSATRRPIIGWIEDFKRAIMLSGAGLAACALAVVVILPERGTDYQTLTSETAESARAIRFQTSRDLSDQALKDLLASHGLTLVSGPSESGVYTATVSGQTDPAAAAGELMSAPEILFAAPDGNP
ncbi:hypothetical protein [Roseibium sp.]|uniref:hypothetical protein n=1 Tax=Roseibium sp. TaxID=1936156 RepID=UPI003A97564B